MRHFSFAFCICLISLLAQPVRAQFNGATPVPKPLQPGFDSITETQAKQWLSILAGPKFAGRGTGQAGYIKAAHFVSGRLAEFGFEPIGDQGTYFQNVPMTQIGPDLAKSFIEGGGKKILGGDDLGFVGYSKQPRVMGKIVILNATGTHQEWPKNLNLRDKIALVVSDKPNNSLMFRIRRKQPLATIRVIDGKADSRTRVVREGSAGFRASAISGVLSRQATLQLCSALKIDKALLKHSDKPSIKIHNLEPQLTVQVRMKQEPVAVPNVVGWLEGSDPKLKHEYITIGAHLDHLGKRGEEVYYGADDNASGSTANLMMARALATNPVRPKRSVLFMAFAAEELGLIGSRYYCDHPLKPLNKMICMLNVDMVGRNETKNGEKAEDNLDTIHLVGSKKGYKGLHELMLNANKHVNFKFEYDEEGVFGRSDQAAFYGKGIPVAFLFAGFHDRYHRPTDTLEGINYKKIAAAAKLMYVALHAASEHGRFPKLPPAPTTNKKKAARKKKGLFKKKGNRKKR